MEEPVYLYKIVSVEDWEKSKEADSVVLGQMDKEFVHLAREDQVERIAEKFWKGRYVVLKLDVGKLKGRLVLEANPGGESKYYHLYEGVIPVKAVVEEREAGI